MYEKEMLLLLGCRNLTTLEEIDPVTIATKYGWELPKIFPMKSIEGN